MIIKWNGGLGYKFRIKTSPAKMIPSECFADEQWERKKSFNYLEALSTTANGKVSLRFCCCSGTFVKLRGWLQFIITLEKIEWAVRLRPKQLQSCCLQGNCCLCFNRRHKCGAAATRTGASDGNSWLNFVLPSSTAEVKWNMNRAPLILRPPL